MPPGKNDTIKVTLSSNKGAGPVTKRITVTTNDPNNKRVSLLCKGKVLAPFKTNPRIVNFGRLKPDAKSVTRTLTIDRGDGGPLKLEYMPLKGVDNLEAHLKEIKPGEKYELALTLTPPWPTKRFAKQLRFKTGVKEAPTMTIPVYAQPVPAVVAEPDRIYVPHGLTEKFTKTIELKWRDKDTPHKITKVSVNNDGIKARLDEKDGKQSVYLEVPADFNPGKRRTLQLSIHTDHKTNRIVRVPISFRAAPRKPASVNKPRVSPRTQIPGKTRSNAAPLNDKDSRLKTRKHREKASVHRSEQSEKQATTKQQKNNADKKTAPDKQDEDSPKQEKKEKKETLEKKPTN